MNVETLRHENVETLLRLAWDLRQKSFPPVIDFVAPTRTMAVSVTGKHCARQCAHCNGRYLQAMVSLEEALASSGEGISSYLVSGGCDERGRVPLFEHRQAIKVLASRSLLNLHSGLVSAEEARFLASLAAVVSFDFVGDNRVIRDVYGFKSTVEDYLAAYRYLVGQVRVVPHLCIGLGGEDLEGDWQTLQLLAGEAVSALSIIVFRPTAGTAYARRLPPPPGEVARFLAAARLTFPMAPLYLGCMRPGGRYRQHLDMLALRAGINRIVQPAPAARLLAGDLGLQINISRECCSL